MKTLDCTSQVFQVPPATCEECREDVSSSFHPAKTHQKRPFQPDLCEHQVYRPVELAGKCPKRNKHAKTTCCLGASACDCTMCFVQKGFPWTCPMPRSRGELSVEELKTESRLLSIFGLYIFNHLPRPSKGCPMEIRKYSVGYSIGDSFEVENRFAWRAWSKLWVLDWAARSGFGHLRSMRVQTHLPRQ